MAENEKETAYKEVGESFRQLDDFRAKLLGLLPLASGAGIFVVLKDGAGTMPATLGMLGAAATLGLWIHECRTIIRCKALIDSGQELEKALQLQPDQSLFQKYPRDRFKRFYPFISTGVASTIVYGSVFLAWLYVWYAGSFGQAPARPGARWEYKEQFWPISQENDALLDREGKEGWELVAVGVDPKNLVRYTFKRPKQR
jgi:hypothetical protein